MIKVLKEEKVPVAQIKCSNCGSLLEYSNADLSRDYERERDQSPMYANGWAWYYFRCLVCGCKVSAGWIVNK